MKKDVDTRAAFRRWLETNDLSPHQAAKKAGISPGTLYNYLAGTSETLSTAVLQKLASVTGQSVEAILTGTAPKEQISVLFRIGHSGRFFAVDKGEVLSVARPAGVAPDDQVAAAQVDGDALLPIPAGWLVFFRTTTEKPENLVGHMAVVRFSGGGDAPVIRTIRRGSQAGLYTLQAFNGGLIEDVEVVAAHRVVSFAVSSQ